MLVVAEDINGEISESPPSLLEYDGGSGKGEGVPRYEGGYNTSMTLRIEGNERGAWLREWSCGAVRVGSVSLSFSFDEM